DFRARGRGLGGGSTRFDAFPLPQSAAYGLRLQGPVPLLVISNPMVCDSQANGWRFARKDRAIEEIARSLILCRETCHDEVARARFTAAVVCRGRCHSAGVAAGLLWRRLRRLPRLSRGQRRAEGRIRLCPPPLSHSHGQLRRIR